MISGALREWIAALPVGSLYDPMRYIMELPAKRIRPVAMLMSCGVFSDRIDHALKPAIGLELFHNFTLMHDDIMDQAPLRRGKPTVHVKWNANSAILSGDAMLVKAYEAIATVPELLPVFNEHALAVCEGQQHDMDFEARTEVSAEEYLEMIRLKTAVLLGCAMRMGAIAGGAAYEDQQSVGTFGEKLGIAFQLRDDLLDAFGDPDKVGKQTGGDLRVGKKTWLLIRALEREKLEAGTALRDQLALPAEQRDVKEMLHQLERYDVRRQAEELADAYEKEALAALRSVSVAAERKAPLRELAHQLMSRTH